MLTEPLLDGRMLRASRMLCRAGPEDEAYPEAHTTFVLAYVERGSFGYRAGSRCFELVPGSLLVGRPDSEYTCTHEHHHGGDECLAFHFAPELVDEVCGRDGFDPAHAVPPLAELMVYGQLAGRAAHLRVALGLDEIALALATRWSAIRSLKRREPASAHARDRRRAVEAALWIEAHAAERLLLEDSAAHVGLSPFHFLRVFSRVIGATPHQYLLRTRLRNAATLLVEGGVSTTEIALRVGFGDLSNFVRTFQRAAGVPPSAFQRASRVKRARLLDRVARG